MLETTVRDRLIVALDFPDRESAFAIVEKLGDRVSFYKVGWRLFLDGGLALVSELKNTGKRVFLDLKINDIEETVKDAVARISEVEPDFLTIQGAAATPKAAKEGRGSRSNPRLLFVPLLSSLDESDLREMFPAAGDVNDHIVNRARRALEMGSDGIIASGEAVGVLRKEFPNAIIVSPGIRLSGAGLDDHKRASTPAGAIKAGADHLVVGRSIRQAPDPVAAVEAILTEIRFASSP